MIFPTANDSNVRYGRRGFTLVELILAIAIAVIVAGLAVAHFSRSYSTQNLKKAADLVRAEFGKARVKTMRSGDIHAFYFIPQSNQFAVGKYSEQDGVQFTDLDAPGAQGQYQFFNQLLPDGVYFSDGDILNDSQSQIVDETVERGQSGTLQRILFYGDGTSQNAKLTLSHESGSSIQVTLRGLTGSATVGRVFDPSEQ